MLIECKAPEAIVKRAFFLAFQACGGPVGMGVFKDRDGVTEDDVWENVCSKGDYPHKVDADKPGEAYGDYVFGRMMKLSLNWTPAGVECGDHPPRRDYQGWCGKYPSYESLVRAAIADLA